MNYEIVKVNVLESLFQKFSFTIKIHGSLCDAGIVYLSCNFYGLTCAPIWSVQTKDKNVFCIDYWLDINDLLDKEIDPYKSPSGWINNVYTPTMRSLFAHSLATGEFLDEKQYIYTEYLIEYYLLFNKLFPDVDYYNNNSQYDEDMSLKTRNLILSNFHIQKTRELYRIFGINAVYWMNIIHEEMKSPSKVNNILELEKAHQAISDIKHQAIKLKNSLHLIEEEEMENLKKKILTMGINKNKI